jgi:FkbM family methyltransferase
MFNLVVSAFNSISPFRGKQRIMKALFQWWPFSNARSYYGVSMVKNVTDSTWRACMVGSYGDFISNYIKSLNNNFIFLDIGSNQGLFGLCAAQNPNCLRVIAFEPNPDTYALLVQNIALAPQAKKFHPVCAAIGEENCGVIQMMVPAGHSGASSSQMDTSLSGRRFSAIAVGGKLLQQIIISEDENNAEIHAKIDVEGAELLVLAELVRTGLIDKINTITIEISANIEGASHIGEIIEFFDRIGWTLVQRSGGESHYDAVYSNSKMQTIN